MATLYTLTNTLYTLTKTLAEALAHLETLKMDDKTKGSEWPNNLLLDISYTLINNSYTLKNTLAWHKHACKT